MFFGKNCPLLHLLLCWLKLERDAAISCRRIHTCLTSIFWLQHQVWLEFHLPALNDWCRSIFGILLCLCISSSSWGCQLQPILVLLDLICFHPSGGPGGFHPSGAYWILYSTSPKESAVPTSSLLSDFLSETLAIDTIQFSSPAKTFSTISSAWCNVRNDTEIISIFHDKKSIAFFFWVIPIPTFICIILR